MSTPERAHVLAKHEELAREIAGELVTDAFWKFGKKPSNKARELCVKWAPIITQALARAEARGRAEAETKYGDLLDWLEGRGDFTRPKGESQYWWRKEIQRVRARQQS